MHIDIGKAIKTKQNKNNNNNKSKTKLNNIQAKTYLHVLKEDVKKEILGLSRPTL